MAMLPENRLSTERILETLLSGDLFSATETLLRAGARIDYQNAEGSTFLHMAAEVGDERVVGLLMEWGAVVNSRDHCGRTALHAAAAYGHHGPADLLIKSGAVLEARAKDDDDEGWTPLFSAALEGYADVVALLLSHGACVNPYLKESHLTPLHLAAREGHTKVVELLITYGASPDAITNHHVTPLHCAAFYNHQDVIQVLVHSGANLGLKSKAGFSAHDFAQLRRQEDVPQLLEFLDSLMENGD
ncbi:ankyrin repeat domain-containing protein [Streptomyces bobili]|uniref:ankyrin repeat domain-containing protein n=1 Tax=Streptomyces bobili TaxID=67280 RepID=UPI0034338AD7